MLSVPNWTSAPTFGLSGRGRGVLRIDFGRTVFGFEAVRTDRLTELGKVSFATWLTSGRGRGVLKKAWTGQGHGPKWSVANVRTDTVVRNSEQ